MSFSFDIAAFIVGAATLLMFWKQLNDQAKLSTRIADLQYCKMVEDKLLAVLYEKIEMRETLHSAPTSDLYKFHFLRGFIFPSRDNLQNQSTHFLNILEYNFNKESQKKFIEIYQNLMMEIKTEDLKKYYKNSQFQHLLDCFNKTS
jgi:hypothetical protein